MEVIATRHTRATVRVGEVFLKVDADRTRPDVEVVGISAHAGRYFKTTTVQPRRNRLDVQLVSEASRPEPCRPRSVANLRPVGSQRRGWAGAGGLSSPCGTPR